MADRFPFLSLAARSLRNRRTTALLTVLSIAVSVALLIGVERIRTEAETGFANTISGTDLIVGARGGAINLLLYSVFRMGEATNNISWRTYQEIARRKEVAWTIPLSLGDSHRGFRVVGTTADYFEHYRFARTRTLEFESGGPFADVFDAVVGAEVADQLGYKVGQQVIIAHGLGSTSFAQHDDKPFTISGILRRTGTPVDRTVHVELAGIEAIHIGWESGTRARGSTISPEEVRKLELQPKAITAFLVGLKSRLATFQLQREINEYRDEALMAIIPGVALQQLWGLLGVVETALRAISAFVVFAGLLGMLISILTTLNERRREMAILRAVGARPWHVFALLVSEAGILSAVGAIAGLALVFLVTFVIRPFIESRYGVSLTLGAPSTYDMAIVAVVVVAALLMGLVPAWRAYSNAVADGMTVRI
jgi:putative ABC transport system permease protein